MSKLKGVIPLDDLEMFELISAAYPEKFTDENNETWEEVLDFVDQLSGFNDIAELLGRVVMLSLPMRSTFTNKLHHVLGKVTIENDVAHMEAVVKRGLV